MDTDHPVILELVSDLEVNSSLVLLEKLHWNLFS